MKEVLTFILILFTVTAFGQKKLPKESQEIVAEGKLLYKSEMASWYGTDLFLENYSQTDNIGGYFSYTEDDTSKCIFFSKSALPKVIGTISFDSTYNLSTAITDTALRDFTEMENDLYNIRENAMDQLRFDTTGFFKFYQNTNPNLIPVISNKEKKVYVLTGPQQSGVVIFGNDYLLTFDEDYKLKSKTRLHNNIIPTEYGKPEDGTDIVGAMHSHLPETGDFITATDICTLMLYGKYAKWETYNVVSEKYLNIWNCETNQLTVIPMSTVNKIEEDQKKRRKKED